MVFDIINFDLIKVEENIISFNRSVPKNWEYFCSMTEK